MNNSYFVILHNFLTLFISRCQTEYTPSSPPPPPPPPRSIYCPIVICAHENHNVKQKKRQIKKTSSVLALTLIFQHLHKTVNICRFNHLRRTAKLMFHPCWFVYDVIYSYGTMHLYHCIMAKHRIWCLHWIRSIYPYFVTFSYIELVNAKISHERIVAQLRILIIMDPLRGFFLSSDKPIYKLRLLTAISDTEFKEWQSIYPALNTYDTNYDTSIFRVSYFRTYSRRSAAFHPRLKWLQLYCLPTDLCIHIWSQTK